MGRKLGGKNKTSSRIEIKCNYCSKEYLIYPCRLKKGNRHNYCSYKCMGLATKGRECKEETRKKLRLHMKGLWKEKILKSKKAWNKGTKGIMRAWNKGLIGYKAGKEHYNWRGGKSFEPYGLEFNNKLKLKIRKRDNFKCRECNWAEKKLGYKLDVHHIDYNKQNNDLNNLISLCRSCHSKTNFQRKDWINYFRIKIQ